MSAFPRKTVVKELVKGYHPPAFHGRAQTTKGDATP